MRCSVSTIKRLHHAIAAVDFEQHLDIHFLAPLHTGEWLLLVQSTEDLFEVILAWKGRTQFTLNWKRILFGVLHHFLGHSTYERAPAAHKTCPVLCRPMDLPCTASLWPAPLHGFLESPGPTLGALIACRGAEVSSRQRGPASVVEPYHEPRGRTRGP